MLLLLDLSLPSSFDRVVDGKRLRLYPRNLHRLLRVGANRLSLDDVLFDRR